MESRMKCDGLRAARTRQPAAFEKGIASGLLGLGWVVVSAIATPAASAEEAAASDRRQIEEVVVTAERKESTVSDTSISITAFTGAMLEDFGIRNQEDLQKFIPAAVIEPYDM